MTLTERITADLTVAMKAKDAARLSALRMLKTALGNAEIDARGSGKAFDDAAQLAVVKRHAKQLAEAAEEYRKGGRADLVSQTESELKIIEQYLPVAMSVAEVRKVVAAVRAKTGATQMGPFMGAVMKELQGKADGAVVRKIVEEMLKS
ncbi:GatB/YqeY domain-containing protein [Candidatus Uhrbacteria bacterium]|nr:GatB/YqeY domain-containing protein [Candidatus Uhrbacteria bacterium]